MEKQKTKKKVTTAKPAETKKDEKVPTGGNSRTPNQAERSRSSRTLISSVSSSPTAALSLASGPITESSQKRSSVSSMDTLSSSVNKRRTTVGTRIGGRQNSTSQEQQDQQPEKSPKQQQPLTSAQIDSVVPQLEQITQLLKDCVVAQQQQEGENANGGGTKGATHQQQQSQQQQQQFQKDREVFFTPPWDTKVGQMQQVVRALQRHAQSVVENRGSIIVRCYPYKSSTYMHLVYNLIYATLASGHQFGPLPTPIEIRPILLHYDDNGMPNPVQQPAAKYNTMPQFMQQPNWTDVVLIRVRFSTQDMCICFIQNFNRTVGRVFDRRQVRAPFAHPDLSQPERVLRHRLQQICVEKNGGNIPRTPRNRQYNTYYNRAHQQQDVRFFHNGIQIYKEYANGRTEPMQLEGYTELHCLHVVVASLRKYAAMYKQKEVAVIIQNIEEDVLTEADMERITALVYSIVTTQEFQKRCQALQERDRAYQQKKQEGSLMKSENETTAPVPSNSHHSGSLSSNTNEFLPAKIERVPRKKGAPPQRARASAGQQQRASDSSAKDKETKTTTTSPEKTAVEQKDEEKKQSQGEKVQQSEAETTAKSAMKERPPLVRIQFKTKEAVIVFCQLFKEFQVTERQKSFARRTAAETDDGGIGHDGSGSEGHRSSPDADSYSDLSDLEEVFSGCEEASGKRSEGSKKRHKKRKQQPKLYFPNAFAHRDLTPPELALGYVLRQFCRERNGFSNTTTSASEESQQEKKQYQQWKKPQSYYTRGGRIFERSVNAGGNSSTGGGQQKQQ